MILFLTYHKVVGRPESQPEFYTITGEQLEHQLELLAQSGFYGLTPQELVHYQPQPVPSYILSFDDGTLDHYEVVLPLLARYHRQAIFFPPTSKLNRPGYATTEQMAEISRAGHTLGVHSHEHRRLDWLGEEDIRVQIQISQRIIEDLAGRRAEIFAPVGGYLNQRVREVAFESGLRVIRTMHWGFNQSVDLTALQCIPVNRYFTEAEFRRVLEFRTRSLVYGAKQVTKKMIPSQTYESLRGFLFGLFKGK